MQQHTTAGTQCLRAAHPLSRAEQLLAAVLAVLFLGPLVAPLFQATGLPVVAGSGALAHDLLARYVCPTPAKSYMLLGFPMAVCARCWGATIGLWGAWLLLRSRMRQRQEPGAERRGGRDASRLLNISWALHMALAMGALLLWIPEMNLWPAAPLPALILNGANGGFWAGMLAGSLWLIGRSDPSRRADAT